MNTLIRDTPSNYLQFSKCLLKILVLRKRNYLIEQVYNDVLLLISSYNNNKCNYC